MGIPRSSASQTSRLAPREVSQIEQRIMGKVMRRAYRDRAEFLGDTDFVTVPVDRLVSVAHAEKLAATIRLDRATASDELSAVTVDAVKKFEEMLG